MNIDILIDSIKNEFKQELKKREELLDKYDETLRNLHTVEHTLSTIRAMFPMKNELCYKCMFFDDCIDASRVENMKSICGGFLAKK